MITRNGIFFQPFLRQDARYPGCLPDTPVEFGVGVSFPALDIAALDSIDVVVVQQRLSNVLWLTGAVVLENSERAAKTNQFLQN